MSSTEAWPQTPIHPQHGPVIFMKVPQLSWILIHISEISGKLGIQPAALHPHTQGPWDPQLCKTFTHTVRVAAVASWLAFQINSLSHLWYWNSSCRLWGRRHACRWIRLSWVKQQKRRKEGSFCSLRSLMRAMCTCGLLLPSLIQDKEPRKPCKTQRRLYEDTMNGLNNIKWDLAILFD